MRERLIIILASRYVETYFSPKYQNFVTKTFAHFWALDKKKWAAPPPPAMSRRDKIWANVILHRSLIMSWKFQHENYQLMIMCTVLISYCVYRRLSWKPITQPNDSSTVVLLSFWSSTRFTKKKCTSQHGEMYRLHSFIFYYIVFE